MLFTTLIIGAICLVVGCLYGSRYFLFERRPSKSIQELYEEFNLRGIVSIKDFEQVITTVAKCYKINSSKLLLTDSFKHNLNDVDSWLLGSGAEKLQEYLRGELGGKQPEGKAETIRDLIILLKQGKTPIY